MQSDLTAVLGRELAPLGFRRRRHSWFRAGPDLYAVVTVQKSAWDEQCFVNLGFAPAGQVPTGWAAESRCPVRFRFDSLHSTGAHDLRLLDPGAIELLGRDGWTAAVTARIARPIAALQAHDLPGLHSQLSARVSGRVFLAHDLHWMLPGT